MKKTFPSIYLVTALLLAMVLLSACIPGQTTPDQSAEPTTDLNTLRTEVAQTVVAQVTYDAALTKAAEPSPTPMVATVMIEEVKEESTPTETLPVVTYTATEVVPSLTPTRTVQVTYPTWTPTYYIDQAELTSQSPIDGAFFRTGSDFDLSFTIKNAGGRAWNTKFYLKFVSGVSGQSQAGTPVTLVYLPSDVPVGSSVTLVIDMIAPSTPGTYSSNWALYNDDGTVILSPNLVINVTN